MNIDNSALSSLFSAGESLPAGIQSTADGEQMGGNFAEALKDQIKQLTNMKEIANQLHEEGVGTEFSTIFGNGLPFMSTVENKLDLENTIEALEDVLNSLENVAANEMDLEARLQRLIEKTDGLTSETLGSVELESKVARLAEELQKIQRIVSQYYGEGNAPIGLTDDAELLETQIEQITKELETVEGIEIGTLDRVLGGEGLILVAPSSHLQSTSVVPTLTDPVIDKQSANPVITEIKKEDLTLRQWVEQSAQTNAEETEADALLQQENAFRKPGQNNPVIVAKQDEMSKILEEMDLPSGDDKAVPKFATDIAMLNKAVMHGNKDILPSMGKHFANPEWNKEMGERVLWMHKQAIPMAELKLNPRHLGPVTIRVDVSQDQATVSFIAQHAVVKEAIEAAIPKLKEMFSAQQLNLAEVNVSQEDNGQKQPKGFAQMGNGSANDQSKGAESMADNEEETDVMNIMDEIEAGRAIASNGILSIFA
jgi:flagellar hook-length control protein FliK